VVSNSFSPVDLRETEKEKGFSLILKTRSEDFEWTLDAAGRGIVNSGTSYRLFFASVILTCRRSSVDS
jgi:hypothetical protein